jgi:cob(I)alamin adenosyltransferase
VKLYTGKGDEGTTGILGNERLSKDHTRIEAYGTIDELNAVLGILTLHSNPDLHANVRTIQSTLFEIGTELASANLNPTINQEDIELIEKWIDLAVDETPDLKSFILPGGTPGSSWFHLARTICRRAERRVVAFKTDHELNKFVLIYLNRLSDLFFAWARLENHRNGVDDTAWQSRS